MTVMKKKRKPKMVYRDRRARQLMANGMIATGLTAPGALFVASAYLTGGDTGFAPTTAAVAALTGVLATTALGCFWLAVKTQDRYDRSANAGELEPAPVVSPPAPPAAAAPAPPRPTPVPPAPAPAVPDPAQVYVGEVIPVDTIIAAPVPEHVR